MGGEPEPGRRAVGEREGEHWDVYSLKEYVLALLNERLRYYDQRFSEGERAVTAALQSQKEIATMALNNAERAVAKAEMAAEKRFDAVNEFRATLADQQRTLMPRAEAEIELKGMKALLEKLETRLTEREAVLVGRVDKVEDRVNERATLSKGFQGGWAALVGILGIISLIVSFLLMVRRG
jgi:small-conductance mechanosensitive channel